MTCLSGESAWSFSPSLVFYRRESRCLVRSLACSAHRTLQSRRSRAYPTTSTAAFGQSVQSHTYSVRISSRSSTVRRRVTRGIEGGPLSPIPAATYRGRRGRSNGRCHHITGNLNTELLLPLHRTRTVSCTGPQGLGRIRALANHRR